VGLDVLVLLAGSEHAPTPVVWALVKQVNGLRNPVYGPSEARTGFERSIALLERLQFAGQATWTSTAAKTGGLAPGDPRLRGEPGRRRRAPPPMRDLPVARS
jgi:hypothetical protein